MKELSLNILDIAQNSVSAGASDIAVDISVSRKADLLTISVTDNGKGMDSEFLRRVTDPFTTTRTTRKVGMGIPLFKLASEMSGGSFHIESELGKGTSIEASFVVSNIDRPPLGDLCGTVVTLIQGSPGLDFVFSVSADSESFSMSTAELRGELGDIPLDEPEILQWISSYFSENTTSLLTLEW